MEVPDASRQGHGGLANEATDALESSCHLNQGKRQLSEKDDQYQELRHDKRRNVRLDAPFDPPTAGPNSANAPATGTLLAANGNDKWTLPDLYDFADGELDNADFELNLFAVNNSAATPKSPEAQTSDDIWQFLSLPPSPDDDKPPPSVLREFDNVSTSTSAPKFDPTLQYSTPNSASPAVDDGIGSGSDVGESMSWDYINCQLHQTYADQVLSFSKERNESIKAAQSHVAEPVTPPSTAVSAPAEMLLRPCKMWFHLQEMLQAKESMYRNQPEVKFELFARVVHTRRENLQKKQLFLLRDLFKIKLPLICGVLLN
ncbi:hypothetical protein BB8028_0001g02570 [Beauveria bassiana]|uniref:Uncharacterized protein n=1 Tax=Beauveria bassiana TaxID=176275 RepID=A0A2S7XW86_BEABA|nr:hypothetical protein BB8028_0001g02570 [Beauveria bassiana]